VQAIDNLNPPTDATAAHELSAVATEPRPSISHSSRWVFAGTILSKPVQLFTQVLIARALGPAGYGVFGLATSMAVTLALIAALGLGDASYKYVAEYYRRDKATGTEFAAVIIWGATIFATVAFGALWFGRAFWISWIFPAGTSAAVVGLCLCLAWTNLIFALLNGVFSGLQRFREFSILNLLQAGAVAALAIVLRFYGGAGVLLAYVGGSVLCIVWGAIKISVTDRAIFSWPGWSAFSRLKTILRFSSPIWLGGFALAPVATLAFAFLARQPNGQDQLGLFNSAIGLRMLVAILPGVIGVVITPALIQEGGTHGDQHAYNQLLERALSSLIVLTVPLLILSLFLSDLLFLVFGKAYGESFRLFMPLTASAAIGAIGGLMIPVMMSKNRTWVSLGFGMIKSLLLVVLSLLIVPRYLGWGLAWAFFASEISYYILALEFCKRTGAVSSFFYRGFYFLCLAVGAILLLALYLHPVARWALAAPLTLASLVFLLRGRRDIGVWISQLAPVKFRPGTEKVLRLITS
jgi:O-antigen/teichoic acid export membrane protein